MCISVMICLDYAFSLYLAPLARVRIESSTSLDEPFPVVSKVQANYALYP